MIISFETMYTLKIIISYLVFYIQLTIAYDTNNFEVRLPNVHPANDDEYQRFTKKLDLPDEEPWYIVEFQPLADMSTVHHMIVRGCKWAPTGEGSRCLINTVTLYAWARNAPNLTLPDGVGFKIGGDIKYINIEVHYGSIANIDSTKGDDSGVNLVITNEQKPKMAGVITTFTMGCIETNSTTCFDTACKYNSPITIFPIAFRTHTHARGLEVSGYNIVTNDGNYDWQLIGKKNPQLPQYFYPVENPDLNIKAGNILAFRCVMKNNENRQICAGSTHNDEMCNFYIMFYVTGNTLPSFSCGSLGPPSYAWETDTQLKNYPEPRCIK